MLSECVPSKSDQGRKQASRTKFDSQLVFFWHDQGKRRAKSNVKKREVIRGAISIGRPEAGSTATDLLLEPTPASFWSGPGSGWRMLLCFASAERKP